MKLAQYVYHLNTFHLLKTECQSKGGKGRIHKTIKKCQEFIKLLTLISLENSLQKCCKGIFPLSSVIFSQLIYWECGGEEGGITPHALGTPP